MTPRGYPWRSEHDKDTGVTKILDSEGNTIGWVTPEWAQSVRAIPDMIRLLKISGPSVNAMSSVAFVNSRREGVFASVKEESFEQGVMLGNASQQIMDTLWVCGDIIRDTVFDKLDFRGKK